MRGVGTISVEILVIGAAVSTLARTAVSTIAGSVVSIVYVEITSGNGLSAIVRSKLGRNSESIRVEEVGNRWSKGILELEETKGKVVLWKMTWLEMNIFLVVTQEAYSLSHQNDNQWRHMVWILD